MFRFTISHLSVAWLVGMSFLLQPAAAQLNTVPFPRDQIALQLGALQMGYTTAGTPFNPTNRQQAANSWLQGRIALANSNGWGRNNVAGATEPTSYGDQLDAAPPGGGGSTAGAGRPVHQPRPGHGDHGQRPTPARRREIAPSLPGLVGTHALLP